MVLIAIFRGRYGNISWYKVNRYYCDNLMESIIENFNESGLEDKNISYFVIITDMNDKEIVRYSY